MDGGHLPSAYSCSLKIHGELCSLQLPCVLIHLACTPATHVPCVLSTILGSQVPGLQVLSHGHIQTCKPVDLTEVYRTKVRLFSARKDMSERAKSSLSLWYQREAQARCGSAQL